MRGDQPVGAQRDGSGQTITGLVTLNLICPVAEQMGRAGEVQTLPTGCRVVLRVAGSPDPAVVDRLRTFGRHLTLDVHGRTGQCTARWVQALRTGEVY